jgi:acetyltransferase
MRGGPFRDEESIQRIVAFHERQDARFAQCTRDLADNTGTPILCATELAVTNPELSGLHALRELGAYCWPSPIRAVRSLEHAWRYARYRDRVGPEHVGAARVS